MNKIELSGIPTHLIKRINDREQLVKKLQLSQLS